MNLFKQILNNAAASRQKRKTDKDNLKKAENDAILEHYRAKLSAYKASILCASGKRDMYARSFESAIQTFSQALELDPKRVDAYISRGIAYIKDGQTDLGKNDFAVGVKLYPGTMVEFFIEFRRMYPFYQENEILHLYCDRL